MQNRRTLANTLWPVGACALWIIAGCGSGETTAPEEPLATRSEPGAGGENLVGVGSLVPPTWVFFDPAHFNDDKPLLAATDALVSTSHHACTYHKQLEDLNEIVVLIERALPHCGSSWAACFNASMTAAEYDRRLSQLIEWMYMEPLGEGTPFFWGGSEGAAVATAISQNDGIPTDTWTVGRYLFERERDKIPSFAKLEARYPTEYNYFQARVARNWALAAIDAAVKRGGTVGWIGDENALWGSLCSNAGNYFNQIEAPVIANAVFNEHRVTINFYTPTLPLSDYQKMCIPNVIGRAMDRNISIDGKRSPPALPAGCAKSPIGNSGLPAGSYTRTCDRCELNFNADTLTCDCRGAGGGGFERTTTLRDVSNCSQEITNCDGVLKCSDTCR